MAPPSHWIQRGGQRWAVRKLARSPTRHVQPLRLRTPGVETRFEFGRDRKRMDAAYLWQHSKSHRNDLTHAAHLLAHLRELHWPARSWHLDRHPRAALWPRN